MLVPNLIVINYQNPHWGRMYLHSCFQQGPEAGHLASISRGSSYHWRFDQEALRDASAEMVIEDEQPFCFGEKPGLKKFLSKACPRFQVPSRRTCTRDIVRHYFEEKAKLKKFFVDSCQRVCLRTDAWTSQVQDGYMTVTTSFIDESWNLHKKVVTFSC